MPVQFTVKENLGQIIASLKRVGQKIPRLTNKRMGKVLEQGRYEASGYYTGGASYGVPKRQGQTYERTGRYGSGTKLVNPEPMRWQLRQSALYSQWVGGGAQGNKQAWFHRGRWPRVPDAMQKAAQKLVKLLPEDLRKLFREEGIGL